MPKRWPACSRSAAASTPGCGRGSSGSRRSWRRSAAPSAGSRSSRSAAPTARAGRRVGLYTSPHLCSVRERIRVDEELIGEDPFADGVDALGTLIARTDATMFEALTALALDHFAREAVEVAVLEVGLGGRLDATTVGEPLAVVLTRIDYDHERYLGSTLAQIAAEKAAIIRGGFAVSAAQPPEAAAVVA